MDTYADDDLLQDTRSWNRAPERMAPADIAMQTHVTTEEPATGANPLPPLTEAQRAQQEADDMSFSQQFSRGALGGLQAIGQNIGNRLRDAAPLGRFERGADPDPVFGTQALKNAAAARRPVQSTTVGMIGSLVPEVAATAGLAAPRVAGAAQRLLRGAAEGGAAAGLTGGDPVVGAVGGALVPAATGTGRALARGIAPTTPEAHNIGTFVPLASAVDPSTPVGQAFSTAYREVLPNVPGGGNIFKQVDRAYEDWRMKMYSEKAVPTWAHGEGHIQPTANESELWDQVQKFYGGGADAPAFGFTNKRRYSFGNTDPDTLKELQSHPKWPTEEVYDPDTGMHTTEKAMTVDGRTLRTIKTSLDNQAESLSNQGLGQPAAAKYATARNIDKTIEQQLPDADADKFRDVMERYGYYKDIVKARAKAPATQRQTQGAYTPKGLFEASRQRAGETRGSSSMPTGGGYAQGDAQQAINALGLEGPRRTTLSKMAAYGMLGGGAYLNPAATMIAPGMVRAATTQRAQNVLMGRTKLQQQLADYLRRNPAGVSAADSAGSIGAGLLAQERE